MTSGGGTATLILRAMLTRISFRHTLIIYAGIHFVLLSVAVRIFYLICTPPITLGRQICLVKEGPGGAAARAARGRVGWVDKNLVRDPIFWSAAISLGLSIFGFFSPYFFMPVRDIRPPLPPTHTTLLLVDIRSISDPLAHTPIHRPSLINYELYVCPRTVARGFARRLDRTCKCIYACCDD
jgi:hypothetical protein